MSLTLFFNLSSMQICQSGINCVTAEYKCNTSLGTSTSTLTSKPGKLFLVLRSYFFQCDNFVCQYSDYILTLNCMFILVLVDKFVVGGGGGLNLNLLISFGPNLFLQAGLGCGVEGVIFSILRSYTDFELYVYLGTGKQFMVGGGWVECELSPLLCSNPFPSGFIFGLEPSQTITFCNILT
jgi:hypothetical protein